MSKTAVLRTALSHRFIPAAAALIGMILCLPALRGGWQIDDLYHRWMFLGTPVDGMAAWSSGGIFSFLDGDPERNRTLIDYGLVPWWTLEDLRLAFWRPLSVMTHRLDYRLWQDSAMMMHLHSLLWYGGAAAAAAVFYRRILGASAAAGLAALLYAVDDAHALPAGWIANRNALVGALFGLLALILHDRWRREGWNAGGWLAPAALLLGLFGSESALGVCAYLAAYALFIEKGSPRSRFTSLLPCAFTALAWLAMYQFLGYGAWGSGFYIHPLSEPLTFLAAMWERLPLLLLGQWFWPPSGVAIYLSPDAFGLLHGAALLLAALLALLFLPLLKGSPTARFWGFGMVLSLIPVCATFPHDRLLLFAGLGAMGLLAEGAAALFGRGGAIYRASPLRPLLYAGFSLLLFVHAAAAPLLMPLSAWMPASLEPIVNLPALTLGGGRELEDQDLVVVSTPSPFFTGYLPVVRSLGGLPGPGRLRVLAPGIGGVHAVRRDERTLVLRPEQGFLSAPLDPLFRGKGHPFKVGDRVALAGMTVTVEEMRPDGRPASASFRFDRPLEDPALRWVRWVDGGYRDFSPPPVGGERIIPGEGMFFLKE